jgi:hypothetical protein
MNISTMICVCGNAAVTVAVSITEIQCITCRNKKIGVFHGCLNCIRIYCMDCTLIVIDKMLKDLRNMEKHIENNCDKTKIRRN